MTTEKIDRKEIISTVETLMIMESDPESIKEFLSKRFEMFGVQPTEEELDHFFNLWRTSLNNMLKRCGKQTDFFQNTDKGIFQ